MNVIGAQHGTRRKDLHTDLHSEQGGLTRANTPVGPEIR